MAKTNETPPNPTPMVKTFVQRFLEQRVASCNLTQAQADQIAAKWQAKQERDIKAGKKDVYLSGKNIATLKSDEQTKLLVLLAYVTGVADESGVIL